ncbi:histidine kinase [Dactylosporangium cerinum]|uniref:histidine kinase n=1 Tax=Dactylosporangium cerinum TaxID=1434730 RepID=A0ABV9VQU8_9ACTN
MRRPFVTDLAIAAVVCVVALVTTRGVPAAGLVPAAVACGALVARRRTPFTVFLVSSVAAEIYLVVHHGNGGVLILAAPLIALYTLAESGSRRRALTIGVLAVLAFAGLHMLVKPSSWLGAENLALAALGGLAVAAGDGARSRREYLAEVEARARQAEHDRDVEAARRVTDERLRIARDLHDVVGHQLALIHVQAGVAAHLLDASPVGAREALGHVRHASQTALGELRDTIGLLRRPGEQLTPTQPVTGLDGLPDLLATFRRSGLMVEASVSGDDHTVTVPVDLTAYRVVQEALTNVRKHAGPVPVRVTLHFGDDALHIVVDNSAAVAPDQLRGSTRGLVRDSVRGPVRDAAHGPARDAAHGPARDATHGPARPDADAGVDSVSASGGSVLDGLGLVGTCGHRGADMPMPDGGGDPAPGGLGPLGMRESHAAEPMPDGGDDPAPGGLGLIGTCGHRGADMPMPDGGGDPAPGGLGLLGMREPRGADDPISDGDDDPVPGGLGLIGMREPHGADDPMPDEDDDPAPGGLGLIGMRERVAALGGTLRAGPNPGGGFRVTAVLPRTAR